MLVWLPCGSFAGAIAEEKGHNLFAWFFGGLLFGPIGLIAAAGLSDRKLRRYQRFQAEALGYKEKGSAVLSDKALMVSTEASPDKGVSPGQQFF